MVRIEEAGAGRVCNGARRLGLRVRELEDRWSRRLQRLDRGDGDGFVRLKEPGLAVA